MQCNMLNFFCQNASKKNLFTTGNSNYQTSALGSSITKYNFEPVTKKVTENFSKQRRFFPKGNHNLLNMSFSSISTLHWNSFGQYDFQILSLFGSWPHSELS